MRRFPTQVHSNEAEPDFSAKDRALAIVLGRTNYRVKPIKRGESRVQCFRCGWRMTFEEWPKGGRAGLVPVVEAAHDCPKKPAPTTEVYGYIARIASASNDSRDSPYLQRVRARCARCPYSGKDRMNHAMAALDAEQHTAAHLKQSSDKQKVKP